MQDFFKLIKKTLLKIIPFLLFFFYLKLLSFNIFQNQTLKVFQIRKEMFIKNLRSFLLSKKIDSKTISVHTFVFETFF